MSGDQESKSKTLLNLAKTRRSLLEVSMVWSPDRDSVLDRIEAEMMALAEEIAKDGEQRRNPMMEVDPRDVAMSKPMWGIG